MTAQIDDELARCAEETRALNYALVHLELEHEIGKIDNQYYEAAFNIIQESLKHIQSEKTDLELTKSKLSNILLGETVESTVQAETEAEINEETRESINSDNPELPEPPVVVYVKEIGKTGI